MARKTVPVEFVREIVNDALSRDGLTEDQRGSLCYVLERVLSQTGNYRGFRYLDGWPTERELARHYF